ncbi:MAG: hypothetical protein ACFE7E_00590 [Candidatus Hodarchaeota archaeon]
MSNEEKEPNFKGKKLSKIWQKDVLPLAVAMILLSLGGLGFVFARNLIEFFLLAELVAVSAFYILFSVLIPSLFPKQVKVGDIFTGGVSKPPYIRDDEILRPVVPFLEEEEEE